MLSLYLQTKFHYVSHEIFSKRTYLENNKENFNAIAIGSSRFYRQLDVELFDSLTNGLNTFNFGIDGLFNPEMRFIADYVLDEYGDGLDIIFLELLDIENPRIENLQSSREYYYLSPAIYIKTLSILTDQGFKANRRRIRNGTLYTRLFLTNILNISKFEQYISRINYRFEQSKIGRMGYVPIDAGDRYSQYRYLLLQDTSVLDQRRQDAIKHLDKEYPNRVFTDWYLDFIQKAENLGVHVIVLMAPRITQYVSSSYRAIPKKNRIRVSDPEKYPEFYYVENSANAGHFNAAGARLFTIEVAKEYNKLNLD